MNRLITLTFLFLPILSFSQSYGLCMQVIGATGGTGKQGNYNVSWTVGETVVTTIGGGSYKLTQGFHQPDVCLPVSTWNLDLEALGLEVFPNPATSWLSIRYTDTGKTSLQASAFDMLGHQVLQPQLLDLPEGTLIDVSNWPTGVYFLQILDNQTRATATLRVLRSPL